MVSLGEQMLKAKKRLKAARTTLIRLFTKIGATHSTVRSINWVMIYTNLRPTK